MCRSANRLLLFAAQLHPTRASKAQSEAAGKLEERSEGEGPHQLSQQRKHCLCFSPGLLVSVSRRRGEFLAQKSPQTRFLCPGQSRQCCSDPRFTSSPWGCCHAWLKHVPPLGPSCCARATRLGDRATFSPGTLGLTVQHCPLWAQEVLLGTS